MRLVWLQCNVAAARRRAPCDRLQFRRGEGACRADGRQRCVRPDNYLEIRFILPILNACLSGWGFQYAICLLSSGPLGVLGIRRHRAPVAQAVERRRTKRTTVGATDHSANYHQSVQLWHAGAGHRPALGTGRPAADAARTASVQAGAVPALIPWKFLFKARVMRAFCCAHGAGGLARTVVASHPGRAFRLSSIPSAHP